MTGCKPLVRSGLDLAFRSQLTNSSMFVSPTNFSPTCPVEPLASPRDWGFQGALGGYQLQVQQETRNVDFGRRM
jgi:hypothetical protein